MGASAGGLESLSALLAALPADFPAPIVVALHQSRHRASSLDAIFARRTSLRVRVIHEPVRLEAGTLYLAPPDRNVTVEGDVASLETDGGGPMPSIDRLFERAASAYGERAIAVILSGTGVDGAAGARDIRSAGGTVLVQDPDTAAFPEMPRSLPVSMVDAEAEPGRLATLLVDFVSDTGDMPPVSDRSAIRDFLEGLRDESGVDFTAYREATIQRRIRRRMAATGHMDVADYLRYVKREPAERQRLINSFLINVTQFFRDQGLFDYLRERVLPELVGEAQRRGEELRIWSAGCSTGEEAYSVAITVSELLEAKGIETPVRIFATDLDESAIAFARRGVYNERSLAALPQDLVHKYFSPLGGEFEVRKNLRSMLIFGEHDLAQRAPFPRIGLILCRNVMIYFTQALQRRALQLFAFSLQRGGYLVLGKSESVNPLARYFVIDEPRLKIFRRVGDSIVIPSARIRDAMSQGSDAQRPPAPRAAVPRSVPEADAMPEPVVNFEQILHGLPFGVVVVDRRYDIQYINSEARRFFGIHTIAFQQDFIHLLQHFDPFEIRRCIDEAGRVRDGGAQALSATGATDGEPLSIEVSCVESIQDGRSYVVVSAVDVSGRERATQREAAFREQAERLIEANEEVLAVNRDQAMAIGRLRDEIERLVIASAELQAATEEVETLNEELQASNEELETLNDELQATVEELNTTNDDLNVRTLELQTLALEGEGARQHLRAVLNAIDDPVLVAHRDGGVESQNAAFTRVFGAHASDVNFLDENGQPLPEDRTPIAQARGGKDFEMRVLAQDDHAPFMVRGIAVGSGGSSSAMALIFRKDKQGEMPGR